MCAQGLLCSGRDGRWDHRRLWVEERLRELTGVFAVEIAAYAVMSNHVHVVQRMAPEVAARWSALEVPERWLVVFGKNVGRLHLNGDLQAQALAADARWVSEKRARLPTCRGLCVHSKSHWRGEQMPKKNARADFGRGVSSRCRCWIRRR